GGPERSEEDPHRPDGAHAPTPLVRFERAHLGPIGGPVALGGSDRDRGIPTGRAVDGSAGRDAAISVGASEGNGSADRSEVGSLESDERGGSVGAVWPVRVLFRSLRPS